MGEAGRDDTVLEKMSNHAFSGERRAEGRPARGDTRPCPSCLGEMRFDDRYTVGQRGTVVQTAAWVCRNSACSYEVLVRRCDIEGE
jgi:hypothetical protein